MTYSVEWQRAYGKFASTPDENSLILMWNPQYNPNPVVGEYGQGMWKGVDWLPILWAYINMPSRAEFLAAYRFANFGEDVWLDGAAPYRHGQTVYVLTDYDAYVKAVVNVSSVPHDGPSCFILESGESLSLNDFAWAPRDPNQDGLLLG